MTGGRICRGCFEKTKPISERVKVAKAHRHKVGFGVSRLDTEGEVGYNRSRPTLEIYEER